MMTNEFKKDFNGKVATFQEFYEYLVRWFDIDSSDLLESMSKPTRMSKEDRRIGFRWRGRFVECNIKILEGINGARYIHFLDIQVRDSAWESEYEKWKRKEFLP
ncbi:MAG: hypothetical protein ACRCZZ_05885 [Phocaeicola sp.]